MRGASGGSATALVWPLFPLLLTLLRGLGFALATAVRCSLFFMISPEPAMPRVVLESRRSFNQRLNSTALRGRYALTLSSDQRSAYGTRFANKLPAMKY